jgi:hypothetical protein
VNIVWPRDDIFQWSEMIESEDLSFSKEKRDIRRVWGVSNLAL